MVFIAIIRVINLFTKKNFIQEKVKSCLDFISKRSVKPPRKIKKYLVQYSKAGDRLFFENYNPEFLIIFFSNKPQDLSH